MCNTVISEALMSGEKYVTVAAIAREHEVLQLLVPRNDLAALNRKQRMIYNRASSEP